ncbi:MAG: alpha/beta fold hydrolase, partial [Calditrichaeota bacterium]|nr:alpha/beta fold hydrolase [Calditrichota bacterium]
MKKRRRRNKVNLRKIIIFVTLSLVTIVIVSVPYLYYDMEHNELNSSSRTIAPGEFVLLPDGYTHYQESGNKDTTTVILVHGFSVPYYIWDNTFKSLVDSGFHVIRYDLFGRGYSDRPEAEYSYDFFADQLNHLIKE